jgi:hypothetical protein
MNNICDAVECAAQTGRLDLVSILLACIGILMALGGIYGFFNVRSKASDIAETIAKSVAEEAANNYLQEQLPNILEAYEDLIERKIDESVVDKIAGVQEDRI